MSWTSIGRVIPIVCVVAMSAACSDGADPSAGPPTATSQGYAGTATCQEDDRDRCYDLSVMDDAYCLVQQVRGMYRDGSIAADDVPSWAVPGIIDGAPRLVDFRGPVATSYDRLADQLDEFVTDQGLDVDDRALRRCRDGLDQETVVGTEGERTVS